MNLSPNLCMFLLPFRCFLQMKFPRQKNSKNRFFCQPRMSAEPIDYTNLICSYLTLNRNKSISRRTFVEIRSIPHVNVKVELKLEDVSDDILCEIILYLDSIQIVRLLRTSKRFWCLKRQLITDRTNLYKHFI